jgi:hypothetical protein
MWSQVVGYRLSTVVILLSLSTALLAQQAPQNGTQVLTPLGYRDRANVHCVLPNCHLNIMADGHIQMQNPTTGDHVDFAKPEPVPQARAPFTDNGWITYAWWFNQSSRPISYFDTTWRVPPEPSTYNGQTIFQFNSIEPGDGNAILQPVLQYGPSAAGGGKYWSIASWYVTGNNAFFTSSQGVAPNESLTGIIQLISHKGKRFSYSCQFFGFGGSKLTVHRIPELIWLTETLEVYGVNQCTDFPNTANSLMYDINVQNRQGHPPLAWSVTNAETVCSVQTTVAINGSFTGAVYIYY